MSANSKDVQTATNSGTSAAMILHSKDKPAGYEEFDDEQGNVKIAFDGDAVLFSDESERIYQSQGLEAFLKHEMENAQKPLPEGPFAKLLKTLSSIQNGPAKNANMLRTALITARNSPAHERVIRTLNAWNIRIDETFFLGGVEKYEVVKAFEADIFFDDQLVHLDKTMNFTPSAKVPNLMVEAKES